MCAGNGGGWRNWGVYMPSGFPEPNQLTGEENCVVANYTQRTGAAAPAGNLAWGWCDINCQSFYTSVCKIPRERAR
jgi:hypothetical protein